MKSSEKSKIETYLGFCVRARKISFGVDDVENQRKGVFLLIADEGLGASSMRGMIRAHERLHCPLLLVQTGALGETLHKPAVKAAAVKDKNLAAAILTAAQSEPQFKLYSGGTN